MENISAKYRFDDFTLSNYKKLLAIALQNYSFSFYSDINPYNDKTIILRHDLEFSVPVALKMARIEANIGIR